MKTYTACYSCLAALGHLTLKTKVTVLNIYNYSKITNKYNYVNEVIQLNGF